MWRFQAAWMFRQSWEADPPFFAAGSGGLWEERYRKGMLYRLAPAGTGNRIVPNVPGN